MIHILAEALQAGRNPDVRKTVVELAGGHENEGFASVSRDMAGEAPFLGKLQKLVFVEIAGQNPAVRDNSFFAKSPNLCSHVRLKKLLDVQGRVLGLEAGDGRFV
jgi:hypothetical protein